MIDTLSLDNVFNSFTTVHFLTFYLFSDLISGDALITVATGRLTEDEVERTGLVPTHAYAVLNVVEIQVGT